MQETWVLSLAQEDPLEEERATHSSILAWRIPWHPLNDRYAKDIVTTNNANIQAYSDEFAGQVEDTENIDFGDWIKYNTGLMPYIKRAAETVHWLHENGYTDYKVNMQSGIIK